MNSSKKLLLALAVASSSSGVVLSAHGAATLEEVVVTARKRAESLQAVPVSVSSFSQEAISQQNIQNFSDFEASTPSLSIRETFTGSGTAIVNIRGMVQSDPIIVLDPSVGMYFDDVYLGRAGGGLFDLNDIERVEVLKGPQGTLYGRNTTGGAVKVISKKADPLVGLEGFVKVGAGNYGYRNYAGAINIPIIDETLAIRLAANLVDRDGYTDAFQLDRATLAVVDHQKSNDKDTESYRASLVWNASDYTVLTVTADKSESDDNGQFSTNDTIGDLGLTDPALATPLYPSYPNFDDDFYSGAVDILPFSTSEVSGYSLVLDQEINDELDMKVVLSKRKTETSYRGDSDGTIGSSAGSTNGVDQEQDSVEIQFNGRSFSDRLNWTAGGFWFEEEGQEQTLAAGFVLFLADAKNQSQSIYFNSSYDVSDKLSFTSGVRYTEDEKSIVGKNRFLVPSLASTCLYQLAGSVGISGTGASCSLPLNDDWNNVSWTLGLDYQFEDGLLIYAKTSSGYRSGGFAFRGADQATLASFDEETVQDFELGIKGDFLDDRLRINTAIYHTIYEDLQQTFTGVPVLGFLPTTGVTNRGEGTIDGVEVELTAVISENFSIESTVAYLNSDFDRVDSSDNGTVLPYTSDWQFSLAGTYTLPVDYGQWLFRTDYSYHSDTYGSLSSELNEPFGEVSLINMRLGLTLDDSGLGFALWARNLADEEYYTVGFGRGGAVGSPAPTNTNTLGLGAPRMVGFDVNYSF